MWLLVRLAVVGAVLFAAAMGGSEPPSLTGAIPAAVPIAVVLGFIEARRLSERVLLANLGVRFSQQVALLVIGAACGESALALLRWLA